MSLPPHETCLSGMGFCGTTLARDHKQKIRGRVPGDPQLGSFSRFEVTVGDTGGYGRQPIVGWEFCTACATEYDRLIVVATAPVIDEDPI